MQGWSCLWFTTSFVQMNWNCCSSPLAWGKSLKRGETALFRNSLKLGKSGAKMTWGRAHEESVLRSVSLQNRWSMSPHSSLSSLEFHLGAFFIYYLLLKFSAYIWFYLLLCPQTTASMNKTTIAATAFRFSLCCTFPSLDRIWNLKN